MLVKMTRFKHDVLIWSGALVRRGIGFFAEYDSGITLLPEVAMKQISNKKYEAYQQYQTDMLHGRILTPDGLRVLCASLDNDPEKIGKHMLEMLTKFQSEGLFDIVVEDEANDDSENDRWLSQL